MARPLANAHIDPCATDLASVMARALRRCTHCHGLKPLTKDWFRFKQSTGRFSSRCIWCECQLEREEYHRHRDEILARKKVTRDRDLAAVAHRRRAYYGRTRETQSARMAHRYRTNPIARLRVIFRTRFTKALGSKNGQSWQRIVGYSVQELRRHIEAQLPPEWTWDNYGTVWVIDHKIPVASFDLPRQVAECWALSNLQPLEKLANLRKGAKLVMEQDV